MKRCPVWILGKGGLLGSQVARALDREELLAAWPCSVPRFAWQEPRALAEQFERAARDFVEAVRAAPTLWCVVWAASSGVIGSSAGALHSETGNWKLFLDTLGKHLTSTGVPAGLVVLASSAGGVYGICPEPCLTEASTCLPISAYGRNKLAQERILQEWSETCPRASYLIGRISNLYGPGQNLAKPQGLISHIARCLIYNRPARIYVPLDTIRDYVMAEDCAGHLIKCVRRWAGDPGVLGEARGLVKMIAAEKPTSIAQIVGIFTHIANRHPRMICGSTALSKEQPARLQFRSLVWRDLGVAEKVQLQVGISRLYQHQLRLFREGRLPVPA